MKFFSLKFLLILLLLSKTPYFRLQCNTKLQSTFKLRGLQYSQRKTMKICPMVQEKCCTLMDELAILKLWNLHGKQTTKIYSDQFFKSLKSLVKYMGLLTDTLSEENIVVHYVKHKWIPYLKNVCLYKYYPRTSSSQIEKMRRDEYFPGDGVITKLPPKTDFGEDPVDENLFEQLDKVSVDLYLSFLSKAASQDYGNFKILQNLYYDEYDLQTLDISRILFGNIDLKQERNEFLKFINVITVNIFKLFHNAIKNYQKKIGALKMNSVEENFQQAYRNFLVEIRNFMRRYNEEVRPDYKYKLIRAFAEYAKLKAQTLGSYILKLELLMRQFVKEQDALELTKEKSKNESSKQDKFSQLIKKLPKLEGLKEAFAEGDIFEEERTLDPEHDLIKTKTKEENIKDIVTKEENTKTDLAADSVFKYERKLKSSKKSRKLRSNNFQQESARNFFDKLTQEFLRVPAQMNRIGKFVIRLGKYHRRRHIHLVSPPSWDDFHDASRHYREEFYQRIHQIFIHPIRLSAAYQEPKSVKIPSNYSGQQMFCEMHGSHFFRSIMVLNKEKLQFCYTKLRRLKEIDLNQVYISIEKAKIAHMNLMNLKKTIYCSVCDVHQQKNFYAPQQLMIFEKEFCQDMLELHSEYLDWLNVYIIELIEQYNQVMACFQTQGDHFKFPFQTKFDKYKKQIFFVKRCLENKDKDNFMEYCHFLCTDYKLQGFSKLWEGDLELILETAFDFYEFTVKMEINSVGKVSPLDWIMQFELRRDIPQSILDTSKGFTDEELREQKVKSAVYELEQQSKYEINKKSDLTSNEMRERDYPNNRLPSQNEKLTEAFIQACKLCKEGNEGLQCREQYCQEPSACSRCTPGELGLQCRLKYCDFFKQIQDSYQSQVLDLENPQNNTNVVEDDVSMVKLKRKREKVEYAQPVVTERKMIVNNKINKKLKIQRKLQQAKQLKKRIIPKKNSLLKERLLSSERETQQEIFLKRLPFYDIDNFRPFFSMSISALNPLKDYKYLQFEKQDISNILKEQYYDTIGENLSSKVMKTYLYPEKEEIKDFKKDIMKNFSDIVSDEPITLMMPLKIKKLLKHRAFLKRLRSNPKYMQLRKPNPNVSVFRPNMPAYQYLLDDVGKESNDHISKVFLGKMHEQYEDPEDPREWQKPYVSQSSEKYFEKPINPNVKNQFISLQISIKLFHQVCLEIM